MSLLNTISRKISTFTNLVENPQLFSLRKYGIGVSEYCFLNKPWFKDFNFATILDIGSNQGQFALMINAVFPEAQIYGFEPIPDCYQKLISNTTRIQKFKAFNLGLGYEQGEIEFQSNDFSGASSFLRMSNLHKDTFPYTKQTQIIKVQVERLDQVANKLMIEFPLLIKVDVQGYEIQVLKGGIETFQKAQAIIIETSHEHLYENQPLFDDIYCQLKSWGFNYKGSIDQMCSPTTGAVLQSDSIFVKD
jgi:FkbM family methyltransferase